MTDRRPSIRPEWRAPATPSGATAGLPADETRTAYNLKVARGSLGACVEAAPPLEPAMAGFCRVVQFARVTCGRLNVSPWRTRLWGVWRPRGRGPLRPVGGHDIGSAADGLAAPAGRQARAAVSGRAPDGALTFGCGKGNARGAAAARAPASESPRPFAQNGWYWNSQVSVSGWSADFRNARISTGSAPSAIRSNCARQWPGTPSGTASISW